MNPMQTARVTDLQTGLANVGAVEGSRVADGPATLSSRQAIASKQGPLTRSHILSAVLSFVGLGLVCSPGLADPGETVLPAAAPAADLEAEPIVDPAEPMYLRPQNACSAELEPLLAGLLRDLPSYANRVARRSLGVNEGVAGYGTLLLAGRAEFEPLDIRDRQFGSSSDGPDAVRQVFFTTLERQYTATEQIHLQQFHWLFITLGSDGWYPVAMFSRLGVDPARETALRPSTPPQESSDSVVGQAVRLWLRDCRAGAVYPVEESDLEAVGIVGTGTESSESETTGR